MPAAYVLRVKKRKWRHFQASPLLREQRTYTQESGMSALCQQATSNVRLNLNKAR